MTSVLSTIIHFPWVNVKNLFEPEPCICRLIGEVEVALNIDANTMRQMLRYRNIVLINVTPGMMDIIMCLLVWWI
jgi:hypothetical protein